MRAMEGQGFSPAVTSSKQKGLWLLEARSSGVNADL
jgi:hypothetical protein